MKMLFEKAVVGFDGSRFFLSYYKGDIYLTDIDGNITLFSKNAINDNSVRESFYFWTEISPEELDDITLAKLYVTYCGNEYEAGMVSKGIESLEIIARDGYEATDKELGFKYSVIERVTSKMISQSEIEDIRVEEISVYQKYLEKYGRK